MGADHSSSGGGARRGAARIPVVAAAVGGRRGWLALALVLAAVATAAITIGLLRGPTDAGPRPTRPTRDTDTDNTGTDEPINLYMAYTNANAARRLNLLRSVTSVLRHTSSRTHWHFVVDDDSGADVRRLMDAHAPMHRYTLIDVRHAADRVRGVVEALRPHFSYKENTYYGQSLFYLPAAMHRIMPPTMRHIIAIDADLVFLADVARLWHYRERLGPTAIMALAHDQQPVYRHALWKWRSEHKDTRVGEPPAKGGLTGFNSGVMLLDLARMRNSSVYNRALDSDLLLQYTAKYSFKGHRALPHGPHALTLRASGVALPRSPFTRPPRRPGLLHAALVRARGAILRAAVPVEPTTVHLVVRHLQEPDGGAETRSRPRPAPRPRWRTVTDAGAAAAVVVGVGTGLSPLRAAVLCSARQRWHADPAGGVPAGRRRIADIAAVRPSERPDHDAQRSHALLGCTAQPML